MEPKTMRLPCPLTDDEVQARATEAAELMLEIDTEEEAEADRKREWKAAIEARKRKMRQGLRRIGVAVAVWGAMAVARRAPPTPSERVASGMVRVLRTLLADTEAELDAERAARRKWELRLRWRAENSYEQRRKWALRLRWRAQNSYEQRHPDLDDIDRLYRHEVCAQRDPQKNTERLGSGITRFRWYFDAARRLPIAGPRGVLP